MGMGPGSYRPGESCGVGRRGEALLLFAHSFAEGEAGGGLGRTPLAPLSTPWVMGAGEKNGHPDVGWGEGGEVS